jgi:methylenetetrahydrofolate dehydrogenase (NADP+)/methenyltetrahydrofolate cyclohydrolase
MQEIPCAKIAETIIQQLKQKPLPNKFLAAILVTQDPASIRFLKQKQRIANYLGIDFRIYQFSQNIQNDQLRKEVAKIALGKKTGGVIIQLPLPHHLNRQYILNVVPREKDIDVLGERALGAFYVNRNLILPPAVATIDIIQKELNINFADKKVAVVGAGILIGKPISLWLMNKTKQLTIFEKNSNLQELKEYEIIITGTGEPGIIHSNMLKEESIIIDFGYKIINGKILGDFSPSKNHSLKKILYTPTPGGTGPILVAKLFENFYQLNNLL